MFLSSGGEEEIFFRKNCHLEKWMDHFRLDLGKKRVQFIFTRIFTKSTEVHDRSVCPFRPRSQGQICKELRTRMCVCVSTVYLSILQLSSFPAANWNCRKLEMRARECIVRVFPIVGTHHSHLVPFSFAHCVLYETNIFALSSFIWSDVFCSGLLRDWFHSQRQSLHLACICRSGSENGYYFLFLFCELHFRYLLELRSRSFLSFEYWRCAHIPNDALLSTCSLHILLNRCACLVRRGMFHAFLTAR